MTTSNTTSLMRSLICSLVFATGCAASARHHHFFGMKGGAMSLPVGDAEDCLRTPSEEPSESECGPSAVSAPRPGERPVTAP